MLELLWSALVAVIDAVLTVLGVVLWPLLLGVFIWAISMQVDPRDVLRLRRILERIAAIAEGVGHLLLGVCLRVYRQTLGGAYLRRSRRRAAQHLVWARRGFGRDAGSLFPASRQVRTVLRSWHQAAPLAAAAYIVKAYILLLVLLNLGRLVDSATRWASRTWAESEHAPVPWWAPSGGLWGPARRVADTGEAPGVVVTVVASFRAFAEAIWGKAAQYLPALAAPEGRVGEVVTAISGIVLALVLLLALRAGMSFLGRRPGPARDGHRRDPGFVDPLPRGWWLRSLLSLRPGVASRTRPVAVLIDCLARVGSARRYYQTVTQTRSTLYVPRVDLAGAERVVWSAWKVRHDPVRGALRRDYRKHAAEVVGVIRRLEARQNIDDNTGQVFEEMARVLVTIAERYASGNTLALLDRADVEGVEPAVDREWVRLVILGVAMTGAAITAGLTELSAAASTQIVAVVGAVAWALLYRDRLSPGDVLDVMRGQTRK